MLIPGYMGRFITTCMSQHPYSKWNCHYWNTFLHLDYFWYVLFHSLSHFIGLYYFKVKTWLLMWTSDTTKKDCDIIDASFLDWLLHCFKWCHQCHCSNITWCHCSNITWCHCSNITWCHCSNITWCHWSNITWCHCSNIPWCHCSNITWCHCSNITWCHCSNITWCHCSNITWCHCSNITWCHCNNITFRLSLLWADWHIT